MFVVICDDKHSDTTPYLFASKQVAIDFALDQAAKYCRYPEDYGIRVYENQRSGMLMSVCYSCEDDRYTVWDVQAKI